MRIAHINNIAGVGTALAEEQKKLGHEVDVYVFNKKTYHQFGGIKINYSWPFSRRKLFRKLASYDLWHYHYPYGSLKNNLEKRNNEIQYLKHYHGADLRGKRDEDFCLVSTPDLLKFAPNGRWLPNPINLSEFQQEKIDHKSKRPRVAHYPYYKNYNSEDNYSKILAQIESKGKCDVVTILNQTHSETIGTIMSCDIVIGKIMPAVGWFGRFELEGMALSKPVIAYVDEDLFQKYKPPVYCTTKETFKQDLQNLLDDSKEKERLSKMGPEYVKKNHSADNIAKTLDQIYSSLS